jgi:hypothetical protein
MPLDPSLSAPCATMSGLSASLYPPRVLNYLPEAKRTRQPFTTEFLASQMERVREVTIWLILAWGEHRPAGAYPHRLHLTNTRRSCQQRGDKCGSPSTSPACRLGHTLIRQAPILPGVCPMRCHSTHHQVSFGNQEINGIMQVGEGAAELGDDLFDALKTELHFSRHRNV